ncbi:glutathione S-transferase family protein [Gimibacter soli]|uniref:Glutathione S-transferase family protein n=1 Tax=Gimibacter soli TaxID=3024400 RepID=A0AAE9XL19_9PROT|nr:glutathione S-transferase family protein [Gimibacter soli]WCL52853.1 glutathione S-transferase family protein [Gimibacter soli]
MLTVYGDKRSGNCLKVTYVADHLGIPYKWVDTDIMKGEAKRPEIMAVNPAGQVPTIVMTDGRGMGQSNAIIRYLAGGSHLIPEDPWERAKMDEWLFWEQYSHEPTIAVARFQRLYLGWEEGQVDAKLMQKGNAALDLMENHLDGHGWLVGPHCSLADVALIAYTQFAEDGGFSLERRPKIRAWLDRTKAYLVSG